LVAEKLELDVDAEGVGIVDCGGKNGIPLVARVCASLEIPFAVLHDDDIWPLESSENKTKQEEENRAAEADNRIISDAVGKRGPLFVAKPTLEAMLGIGRSAKDKPLKVVEKMRDMELSEIPPPLVDAVKAVLPSEIVKPDSSAAKS
jgi:hypothetical protein